MASFKFPIVDFSPIGELPQVARETGSEFKRREILADLKAGDAASLRTAGTKLISLGDLKSITAGRELHSIAQAQEALAQKGAFESGYLGALSGTKSKSRMNTGDPIAGTGTPGGGDAAYPPAYPSIMPEAPPARGPAPAPADWGGAQGTIPGGAVPKPRGTLVEPPLPFNPNQSQAPSEPEANFAQRFAGAGPVSPSEELIQAAQAGGAPPPPTGPSVAQAGGPIQLPPVDVGAPPPPPPPMRAMPDAPPELPAWLGAAQQRPPGVQLGGPETPPGPPPLAPRQGPPPRIPGLTPELQQEINATTNELLGLHPKASAQRAALLARLKASIDKGAIPTDVKEWYHENLDNWQRGDPQVSLSNFRNAKENAKENHKELIAVHGTYRTRAQKANELMPKLEVLGRIVQHKDFISGEPTASAIQRVGGLLGSMRDTLVSMGVPEEKVPFVKGVVDRAKLIEAFRAISNEAVIATLGGLGNQISNSDVAYITAAFPSIAFTKAGNQLLIDIHKAIAKRSSLLGNVANDYREKYKFGTAPEMERKLVEFGERNRIFVNEDGSKTELGNRIEFQLETQKKDLLPPPPRPRSARNAPPRAAPPIPTQAAPTNDVLENEVFTINGKRMKFIDDGTPQGKMVPAD